MIVSADIKIKYAWIKNDYKTTSSIIAITPHGHAFANYENYEKCIKPINIIELSGYDFTDFTNDNDISAKLDEVFNFGNDIVTNFLQLSNVESNNIIFSSWFNCIDQDGNSVSNFFDEEGTISGIASGEILYLSSNFIKRDNRKDKIDNLPTGISDLLADLTLSSSNIGFRYYPGVFRDSQTITPGQPQDITHDLTYKEIDQNLFDD